MCGSTDNSAAPAPAIGFRFGLPSLLIFVTVVCALFAWLVPAIQTATEASRRRDCNSRLWNIAFALDSYHNDYGCFPPPFVADSSGKAMHSWRLLITPFMSGYDFYAKYDLSQPWNSPKNLALTKAHPWRGNYFRCSTAAVGGKSGDTSYMMIVGSQTASRLGKPTSHDDISDGLSHTILVAEVADSGVFWTEPRDLSFDEMSFQINDKSKPSISSHHARGAMVIFADRRVEFLDESISSEQLKALLTSSAGDSTEPD